MYQGLSLTSMSYYLDAQGFKRFLRVVWEPFEAKFQPIEAKFIHHANIVVRLASVEHQTCFQTYFYTKEAQDKRKQEGEYYCHRVAID